MLWLASTADVLTAIGSARSISFEGYMLHPGRLFDALDAAARRGAHVQVRVEASPYRSGSLGRLNASMVARLHRDGADACETGGIHTKALDADGVRYLDDCNWLEHGGDTILRDDVPGDPALAATKGAAIAQELQLLANAEAGDRIDVESESFGNGPICGALARAAHAGARVRLLVGARERRQNVCEAATIDSLRAAGVEVRTADANEKFAIRGDDVWIGSANATYGAFDQSDWGAFAGVAAREHCRAAFEQRWDASGFRDAKVPARRLKAEKRARRNVGACEDVG